MEKAFTFSYLVLEPSELTDAEQNLIKSAREIAVKAHAPYSKYKVGAAILLDNGKVITGNNQENIAFPSGTCAERSALYYAKANFPESRIKMIAVARNEGIDSLNIPPCGACRQAIMEYELQQKDPIVMLLDGQNEIVKIHSCLHLLPFVFNPSELKA